ncbi:MAG: response regulator [Minisyncoccales bacterium]
MTKLNKKILIIEGKLSTLMSLVNKFSREGFYVIKAENGKEGLKLALKEHPDLVLLDIVLPKMDGIAILKKLRIDDWGEGVPVIIWTDLNDIEITAVALENKVYDFLLKTDWKIEDVVKKVKQKLRIL